MPANAAPVASAQMMTQVAQQFLNDPQRETDVRAASIASDRRSSRVVKPSPVHVGGCSFGGSTQLFSWAGVSA